MGWKVRVGVPKLVSYSDTIYFTEIKLQNLKYENFIEKKGGGARGFHGTPLNPPMAIPPRKKGQLTLT